MIRSSAISAALLLACLCPLGKVAADEKRPHSLTWADGGTITGTIRSLNSGVVVLDSPISKEPLQIRSDRLTAIALNSGEASPVEQPALITLVTGEMIPCQPIRLDSKSLLVSNSWGERLTIPRTYVASGQLNLVSNETILSGPKADQGWAKDNIWTLRDDRVISNRNGSVHLPVAIPDRAILRTTISWQERPSLTIGLFTTDGPSPDRFDLVFNNRGFSLQHISSELETPVIIGTSYIRPIQFDDQSVQVELRIDRRKREFELVLNGIRDATFSADQLALPASGKGLTFHSSGNQMRQTVLSDVQLTTWESTTAITPGNPSAEGEDETDVIFAEGDRISGELASIDTMPNGSQELGFMTASSSQVINVPLEIVSDFFLAGDRAELPGDDEAKPKITISLAGGGELQVTSISIGESTLNASHPFIGEISIPQAEVINIKFASVAKD